MTKKELKIIRKWSKLRHWDWKNVERSAIALYENSNDRDKKLMLFEFSKYINDCKSGIIKPSPVEMKIPKFFMGNEQKTLK